MRTWTLELPYTKPPLSLNARPPHWRVRHRITRNVRAEVALLARAARIPALQRIAVELHYVPRDRRRRDPINLAPTAKVLEDGLVDAGVVPDDTPQYVEPTPAVIDPPTGGTGRLYLVVRELPSATPTTTLTHEDARRRPQ